MEDEEPYLHVYSAFDLGVVIGNRHLSSYLDRVWGPAQCCRGIKTLRWMGNVCRPCMETNMSCNILFLAVLILRTRLSTLQYFREAVSSCDGQYGNHCGHGVLGI